MLHMIETQEQAARSRLSVRLAHGPSEILEAQKLRYRVFAEELGARLPPTGIDRDLYDPFCEHLIVRDDSRGRIVGTYRILSPAQARRAGAYYSEGEFDLVRMRHLRERMVEVGRACIDADYRSGAVISLLWSGLARYVLERGYEHLIGCASVSMADGGHNAANLYLSFADELAPLEYRVFPRCRLPFERLADGRPAQMPPLLKGYLRAGAQVCGEPAWDPDFNTADLLLLLPLARVRARYARHFLERAA